MSRRPMLPRALGLVRRCGWTGGRHSDPPRAFALAQPSRPSERFVGIALVDAPRDAPDPHHPALLTVARARRTIGRERRPALSVL